MASGMSTTLLLEYNRMHIEFLVEEPSTEAALSILLLKLLGDETDYTIINFGGKSNMKKELSGRLKGYRDWLPSDWRLVVLRDRDEENCHDLKKSLETSVVDAGFVTRTISAGQAYQALTRIAIEELEAWFFGDIEAIVEAYPGVSPHLASQAAYRDPDSIRGGTAEALERELQRAGHHRTGLRKIEAARKIAEHMDPTRNRSRSFQVFRAGLLDLIN